MDSPKHPNRFPGTDDVTGWPLEPKYPCIKSLLLVICHMRMGLEPMVCGYEAADCPFYGHFPDLSKNK